MASYQEIRRAGQEFHRKVLNSPGSNEFDPIRIAKRMTLPRVGKTLVFDDESSQFAFFDFWLHEYRVNGRSLMATMDAAATTLTPLEKAILLGHQQSRTSLFEVVGADRGLQQVQLRDLLEPDRPMVNLTDHGLSDSISRLGIKPASFFRLVTVEGITMTSGFSFLFVPSRVPGLLQSYRQHIKKVAPQDLSEQRFIFFFRKHREWGEEQIYADVR